MGLRFVWRGIDDLVRGMLHSMRVGEPREGCFDEGIDFIFGSTRELRWQLGNRPLNRRLRCGLCRRWRLGIIYWHRLCLHGIVARFNFRLDIEFF